jgi:hypothetical protein
MILMVVLRRSQTIPLDGLKEISDDPYGCLKEISDDPYGCLKGVGRFFGWSNG